MHHFNHPGKGTRTIRKVKGFGPFKTEKIDTFGTFLLVAIIRLDCDTAIVDFDSFTAAICFNNMLTVGVVSVVNKHDLTTRPRDWQRNN